MTGSALHHLQLAEQEIEKLKAELDAATVAVQQAEAALATERGRGERLADALSGVNPSCICIDHPEPMPALRDRCEYHIYANALAEFYAPSSQAVPHEPTQEGDG